MSAQATWRTASQSVAFVSLRARIRRNRSEYEYLRWSPSRRPKMRGFDLPALVRSPRDLRCGAWLNRRMRARISSPSRRTSPRKRWSRPPDFAERRPGKGNSIESTPEHTSTSRRSRRIAARRHDDRRDATCRGEGHRRSRACACGPGARRTLRWRTPAGARSARRSWRPR